MSRKPPTLLAFRSSTWFIVTAVCVACFTDSFIYGVIIPVLPFSLRDFLGVRDEDIQFWNSMLLASFGAAQLFFSPVLGHLADKSPSRKTPLLIGLIGTAAATLLLYLARNVYLLVLSRFLQGLAASVVYTVGFALLSDTVPSEDIGQWMGFAISSLNVGMIVSPTLGGILYDNFGYGSLFVAVFALVAIDIVLRVVIIEKKVASSWDQVPDPETQSEVGALKSFALDLRPQEHSAGSSSALAGPSPTQHALPEQQSLLSSGDRPNDAATQSHPHALVTLMTSLRILTDLYGAFITVFVLVSFDAAIPLFAERQFGWSSTGGGLIFLFITGPILIGPFAGRLYDRYPSPLITAMWFVLSAAFTASLSLVTHKGLKPLGQQVLLCVLLTLYGFARAFGSSPLSADLSRAVKAIEDVVPGIFGSSGASAQVFALYTSASAAGVILGPLWTSFAYGEGNWTFLVCSLGFMTASVAIPLLFSIKRVKLENVV